MRQVITKSACPFCGELTYYKQEDGAFCCFSCFKEGPDFLSEVFGIEEPETAPEILETAAGYFQKHLKECRYATERKITGAIADRFRIGFDNGHLCEYLIKKGYSKEDISSSGLGKIYEDGNIVDTFRYRMIFPIMTTSGVVTGFGGRRVTDFVNSPKYINSMETNTFKKKNSLYGVNDIDNFTTVYLVEGYMDVVTLHKKGVRNAVAALGTAVGKNHALLLKGLGVKKVIVALDSDEPGIKAALRAVKVLKEYFEVEVLNVPGSKDADEFLQKHTAKEFYNLKTLTAKEYVLKNSSLDIDILLSTLS